MPRTRQLLAYTKEQINLLAAYGEYAVTQNAELFATYLSPAAPAPSTPTYALLLDNKKWDPRCVDPLSSAANVTTSAPIDCEEACTNAGPKCKGFNFNAGGKYRGCYFVSEMADESGCPIKVPSTKNANGDVIRGYIKE